MEAKVEMLEAALSYARLGWKIVPIHAVINGRCTCGRVDCERSAGKHPRENDWPNLASSNADTIKGWFSQYRELNIGIKTGNDSGIFVVDIDCKEGGHNGLLTLEQLESEGKVLPPTLTAKTPSGGEHRYFILPEGMAAPTVSGLFPGIDIRGDKNGQVLVEPSNIPAGRYQFDDWDYTDESKPDIAEPPDWLLQAIVDRALNGKRTRIVPERVTTTTLSQDEAAEIRSALAMLAMNTQAAEDRDLWIRVGMALHSTGASNAYPLWVEFSQTCPSKFSLPECQHQWNSLTQDHDNPITLGTLFQWAEEAGWQRPRPEIEVDLSKVVLAVKDVSVPTAMPLHLYKVPGMLSRFYHWTLETAYSKQPKLTVAAALTLGASAIARRYTWMGARSSLLQIAIAPSTSGKEHPRACLKHVIRVAGFADSQSSDCRLIGEQMKSGSALWNSVAANPCGVALIDEYGLFLQSVFDPKGNPHKREFSEQLLRIGTSYNSIALGAEAADRKNNPRIDIEFPCINIFATTTPETLIGAMRSSHIVDGFLGRHLTIETETPLPSLNHDPSRDPPPADLVAWYQRAVLWKPYRDGRFTTEGDLPESPIRMRESVGAKRMVQQYAELTHQRRNEIFQQKRAGIHVLWGRAIEQVKKVAMVLAASDFDFADKRPDVPMVDVQHVQWAIDYVNHCIEHAEAMAIEHVADNDFEKALNAARRVIDKSESSGITMRELIKSVRGFRSMDPRARGGVIKALEAEGYREVVIRTGGRPRTCFINEVYIADR